MVLKFKKSAQREVHEVDAGAGLGVTDDEAVEGGSSAITMQPGSSVMALQVEQTSQASGERAFQLGSRQAGPPSKNRGSREPDRRPANSRETLVSENARLSKALERMNSDMDKQAQRDGELLASLDRVNETLAGNAKVFQAHSNLLTSIRDAVSDEVQSHKHLADELVELPKIADLQRETMVSISRQLELVRETTSRVSDVLSEFQAASSSLATEIKESTRTVGRLVLDIKEREQRVERLVQEQVNRLKPIVWTVLALAAVMALTGIIGLFR